MKFNIGQEVAVSDYRNYYFGKKGVVTDISIDERTEIILNNEIYETVFEDHHLAPANTLEGLVPGDVVLDEDGEERTVIERLSQSVLLSDLGERDMAYCWYTFSDLKELGYTVKSAPKEEPKDFPQFSDAFYRINILYF